MKVLKFGGTSVASPENILKVFDIVKDGISAGKQAVVVSAFGGATDDLIRTSLLAEAGDEQYKTDFKAIEDRHIGAVKRLISVSSQGRVMAQVKMMLNELEDVLQGVFLVKERSEKSNDFISGFGERLSSYIIAEAFIEKGLSAKLIDFREFIRTDQSYGRAKVDFISSNDLIRTALDTEQSVCIIPGFVAISAAGELTTLGRGGSDYTAAIVAAAMEADVLEIWTDVDGVMTANPRQVPKAIPMESLTYDEAMELSYFGAKVIYPPTIQPVLQKHIPIYIKNTFNPTLQGTLISDEFSEDEPPVKGVSSVEGVALLTLSGSGMVGASGIAQRMFSSLAAKGVNIILISQASSEHTITVGFDEAKVEGAKLAIYETFELEIKAGAIDEPQIEGGMAIIAAVGRNMRHMPGISGKLFSSLGQNGVNIVAIAQGSSELNISFVVKQGDVTKALNTVHEEFFLSKTKVTNLFVVGMGTVGGTLLGQIRDQLDYLSEQLLIDINLIGLTNSRKMLFNEEGIDWNNWKGEFDETNTSADLDEFLQKIIDLNLRNSILIDCTASDIVAKYYQQALDHNVAVITPNKIACSSEYPVYKKLKDTTNKRGVRFLYETNVGAGLPVLGTLSDLIRSGDKVHKIQAILSGTMNYIFNNVSSSKKLSDTVVEAREMGFAEPDPRIDLSGVDVARKILILARDAGYQLELDEVTIEPFLPESCQNTASLDEFWEKLRAYDDEFEEKRKDLEARNCKYRLVATFDKGKASISLQEYEEGHLFHSIEGTDNIVLFTTERYQDKPLVIRGAGAGAGVTAMGIFADIIRTVH